MRFCACVIAYYPDEQLLRKNVACYREFAEKVFIWQNTPLRDRHELGGLGDNVEWLGEEDNVGISRALNAVLRRCQEEGIDYLLTMDQDSQFVDFSYYLRQIESQMPAERTVSFAPMTPGESAAPGCFEPKNYVITSGSMVNVPLALSIGGYREEFLVDGIDMDFCFKAQKAGLQVVMVGGATLRQRFGETIKVGDKEIVSYPPKRLYAIVKSQWMLWADYPQYFRKLHFLKIFYLGEPYHILFFQKDKCRRLWAILRATVSGLRYRIAHL